MESSSVWLVVYLSTDQYDAPSYSIWATEKEARNAKVPEGCFIQDIIEIKTGPKVTFGADEEKQYIPIVQSMDEAFSLLSFRQYEHLGLEIDVTDIISSLDKHQEWFESLDPLDKALTLDSVGALPIETQWVLEAEMKSKGRVKTITGKPHKPRKLVKDKEISPEEASKKLQFEASGQDYLWVDWRDGKVQISANRPTPTSMHVCWVWTPDSPTPFMSTMKDLANWIILTGKSLPMNLVLSDTELDFFITKSTAPAAKAMAQELEDMEWPYLLVDDGLPGMIKVNYDDNLTDYAEDPNNWVVIQTGKTTPVTPPEPKKKKGRGPPPPTPTPTPTPPTPYPGPLSYVMDLFDAEFREDEVMWQDDFHKMLPTGTEDSYFAFREEEPSVVYTVRKMTIDGEALVKILHIWEPYEENSTPYDSYIQKLIVDHDLLNAEPDDDLEPEVWYDPTEPWMEEFAAPEGVCLFCDETEDLEIVNLDGWPEELCETCRDPEQYLAENWGGDPEGPLAKALEAARAKKPKELRLVRLPAESFSADTHKSRRVSEVTVEVEVPDKSNYQRVTLLLPTHIVNNDNIKHSAVENRLMDILQQPFGGWTTLSIKELEAESVTTRTPPPCKRCSSTNHTTAKCPDRYANPDLFLGDPAYILSDQDIHTLMQGKLTHSYMNEPGWDAYSWGVMHPINRIIRGHKIKVLPMSGDGLWKVLGGKDVMPKHKKIGNDSGLLALIPKELWDKSKLSWLKNAPHAAKLGVFFPSNGRNWGCYYDPWEGVRIGEVDSWLGFKDAESFDEEVEYYVVTLKHGQSFPNVIWTTKSREDAVDYAEALHSDGNYEWVEVDAPALEEVIWHSNHDYFEATTSPAGTKGAGMSRLKADAIINKVKAHMGPHLDFIEVCGSYRRGNQTPKDLDFVIIPKAGVTLPNILPPNQGVNWVGDKKAQVVIDNETVDFRVSSPTGLGAALMYFTGPAGYNIGMRMRAKKMGLKLNEYGVFDRNTGAYIAGATEADVYQALGKNYKAPDQRGK